MDRRTFLIAAAGAGGSLAIGNCSNAGDGAAGGGGVFQLPALPYAPEALEPHIDARTMGIHHGKHHAGYTSKLNEAVASLPELKGVPIESILGRLTQVEDPALRAALRNNGGGFYNHRLFWEIMAPEGATGAPSPSLARAIDTHFGSRQQFEEVFNRAGAAQFGSGWAWLTVRRGELAVTATPNQDNPLMTGIVPGDQTGTPILGVDVWEHAYYLKYQNRRGDYLNAWWKVVNWDRVSANYEQALAAGA